MSEQDSWAGIPQYHWSALADSLGKLMVKFQANDLPPRPFKLVVGRAGFRITDENIRGIALGMLLCSSTIKACLRQIWIIETESP